MKTYLIWSHQKNAWWMPDGRGYTSSLYEAGRFSEAAAADQLRWDRHHPSLEDGRPNEVVIEAPTVDEMRDVNVLPRIRDRVDQATAEAIVARAGQQVNP
jgi:hypothetical protein